MITSADELLQVAADVNDVQPPQLTDSSSLPTSLPVLSTSLVDLQSSITILPADHTYHHASKPKCPSDAESVAAAERTRYLERRRKNNAASKRSREIRKHQQVNMEEEVVHLEQVNANLRQRVAELERLTSVMKSALVDAIRQGT